MLLLYVERAVVVLLAAVALLLAIVSFRQASGSQCLGFGIRCLFDLGIQINSCLFCSAANSGSGAFVIPGSGMGKKSGSGMNIPGHISES